jgi:hypothetical protein
VWLVSIGIDAGIAAQRKIRTEREGRDDSCRGGICCGVEQALLEFGVFMKHRHDAGYGFVNVAIIRITIMSSASLH